MCEQGGRNTWGAPEPTYWSSLLARQERLLKATRASLQGAQGYYSGSRWGEPMPLFIESPHYYGNATVM